MYLGSFSFFLAAILVFLYHLSPTNPGVIPLSVTTPGTQLRAAPSLQSGKNIPLPITKTAPKIPWGTTEKIADHEYRTYVASDPKMGTPAEILQALNLYRQNHGAGQLQSDDKLCGLAGSRAIHQDSLQNLDAHRGLIDYMNDPKHWQELNISSIGENASYGYVLSGVHLIEWVFDADEEHRSNQLDGRWNLACAGTSGVTVDIIFGKR